MHEIKLPQMKTIKEIAEITKLPQHFVRQLVLLNKVPHVMAGRKYLINLEKFIDFLNTGEHIKQPENKEVFEITRIAK